MTSETLTILLPAFVAGLLVFAAHVPLGTEVLKRGIIFIDLAIAQIAALGAVAAGWWLGEDMPFLAAQGLTLLFALLGAAFFQITEKRIPVRQEAIIGASFVVASSAAILLVAGNPHGGEALESMLAGQILWASWQQIAAAAMVYSAVLALWFTGRGRRWFYYLFAVTITVSVQLVGVYLVFASLILPALGAGGNLRKAYVIAFISLVAGLLASTLTDLPTGPVLVVTLSAVAAIFTHQRVKLFR